MTFRDAASKALLRFLSLNVAILSLALPAKFLRGKFFPEGLSGDVILVGLMLLMISAAIALVTYVSAPLQQWWAVKERRLRSQLEQSDE